MYVFVPSCLNFTMVINDNQLILGKETNADGEIYMYILSGCQEFHRS